MTPIYVVYANHDVNGIMVCEVFDDLEKALHYEKNQLLPQLSEEYGPDILQAHTLTTGFATRSLNGGKK